MTFIEIMRLFTFYGVDIAVLGIATSALTQLLKTTILKNAPNKLYAFLPVIIGNVLYAVYTMLAHMSFCYVFENIGYVLENGFSVGAAATVIYVVYEQFVRGKSATRSVTADVVAAIIADWVEPEKLDEVAQKIEDEFDSSDLQSAAQTISKTLYEYAQGDADKDSVEELSVLVAQTLARIKKATP